MTEVEFRIQNFDQNCRKLRGKRIFLYGLGKNTMELLSAWDDSYHFEALIAPDEEEKERFLNEGKTEKTVLLLDEVVKKCPDVVLIASQMYSLESIYERIADICIAQGISVFDMYGTDQIMLHQEMDQQCYQDLSGWKRLTEEYDVISVELLDTVIFRDLFHDRDPGIRPVMKQLLKYCKEKEKILLGIASEVFETDWYQSIFNEEKNLPKDLFACIITREHTEVFFRKLKSQFPEKKILHIGKDILEDVLIPRLCGWDSYRMVFFDNRALLGYQNECVKDPFVWKPELYYSRIDRRRIVSFDIFDTLLTRGVHSVSDVFETTAKKALDAGILKTQEEYESFIQQRKQEQSGTIFLRDIYSRIGDRLSLSQEEQNKIRKLEIETEYCFLDVRKEGADLFSYAKEKGKKIILVTDMYLTSRELKDLLESKGFSGIEYIYVSCEHGLTKNEGLFQIPLNEFHVSPDQILHIGDRLLHDCLPAHRSGLDYFWLPKGTESEEKKLYAYGLLGMAPLIHAWMEWFIGQLHDSACEKVLFSARDGWMLQKIYEKLKPEDYPDSIYFYTSRRAAFLPSSDNREAVGYIRFLAGNMPAVQAFSRFYNVMTEEKEERLSVLFDNHYEEIQKQSEKSRQANERYWKKCGLETEKTYAFVDFVTAGTVKRLLDEIVPFSLKGFFFGSNGTGGILSEGKCFLSDESESSRKFLARYIEMEFFMTSPEPSLLDFDVNGDPVFAEEVRTPDDLEKIKTVQQGVMDYFSYLIPERQSLSVVEAIRQYLQTADFCPKMRYYDDWSGREISLS